MRRVLFRILPILGFVATTAAAAVIETSPDIAAALDKKPEAMRVYGLRRAVSQGASGIRVYIGASCTSAASSPGSYRIVSADDPDYAYEKFMKPAAARLVHGGPTEVEYKVPDGFEAPRAADLRTFMRTVVDLALPVPMKEGHHYAVVAQGVNDTMVTGARTAAEFVFRDGPVKEPVEDPAAASIIGLRGASSLGNGLLMLEFGAGFSAPGGSVAANYRVTVNDEAAPVKALGRISRIDVYLPVGWPFKAFLKHDVFLDIGRVLKDGDKVRVVAADAVTAGANATGFTFDSRSSFSDAVRVNQVGYLPDAPKTAYLGRWLGSFPEGGAEAVGGGSVFGVYKKPAADDAPAAAPASTALDFASLSPAALRYPEPPPFSVCDAATGKPVFSGRAEIVHNGNLPDGRANHSGENVYRLDFSAFRTPGDYFISVPGTGRGFAFRISDDVYARAFDVQARGLFAQRCGIALAPPFVDWRRIACHTNGVMPTTLDRRTTRGYGELRKNVLTVPNPQGASPALRRIRADKAVVIDDSFEGRTVLTPLGRPSYVKDGSVTGGAEDRVYATGSGINGFSGTVGADLAGGFAISFWYRRDDDAGGGNRYDGSLVAFDAGPRIDAGWGVLRFGETGYRRVGDGAWRHFVVNAVPDGQSGAFRVDWYVDGTKQAGANMRRGKTLSGAFQFAALKGVNAAGSFFDELRVFSRPLRMDEIRALGERVSDRLPVVLATSGGHHDAGDYNPRSHIDVAQVLFDAYELAPKKFYDGQLAVPERGNGIPDLVDEGLWALRLWNGLQDTDGGVYDGTESQGDPNFIQTVELDDKGDFAYAKDAKASFTYAGVAAQASRILAGCGKAAEAAALLGRAERAYAWGLAHPPPKNLKASARGEYYVCPRAYADAQLLATTGTAKYNADFLANSPWRAHPDADLAVPGGYDMALAAYAYARVPDKSADATVKAAVRAAIVREADMFIAGSDKMAYKFIRHPDAPISWGTGAYENFLAPVVNAWALTGDRKYHDWIVHTCDNTLGANPMNTSWIVGLGTRTVRAPLHNSRYNPTGMVVAGQQVEGPLAAGDGYSYAETAYPRHRRELAPLYSFVDCHFAIAMDEGVSSALAKSLATFGLLLPDHR